MKNKLDRYIPQNCSQFIGAEEVITKIKRKKISEVLTTNEGNKLFKDISSVLEKLDLKNGMVVSFHHHLRNGDYIINMVLKELQRREIKNITLVASAIFPVHEPLVSLIKDETITKIYCNYINGSVANCVSEGHLKNGLVMQTHGGRPRSIESGEVVIDVAFIATPTIDFLGNGTGAYGKSACGVLGYAISDMLYAKKKVVISDNVVANVKNPEILAKYIDYCVEVDTIGDASKIVSGTTKVTRDPIGLKIARDTANIIAKSGYLKDGFSFQTGAGGTSLAVASELKKKMLKDNIKGSFASGGITGYLVEMLELGLFEKLWDVQCFDLEAVRSFKENKEHMPMSASKYANPYEDNVVVNDLDVVILGATEVDLNFNVNVTTDSNGKLMGGSGGHSDTAYGAKLTIIVTQLMKSRMPIIKDSVTTVTTPGESIDVIVTERGIAINPRRKDLIEKLKDTNLNIMTIEELQKICYVYTGVPNKMQHSNDVVGVVQYRDGTVIDSIYKIDKEIDKLAKFNDDRTNEKSINEKGVLNKSTKVKIKQETLNL